MLSKEKIYIFLNNSMMFFKIKVCFETSNVFYIFFVCFDVFLKNKFIYSVLFSIIFYVCIIIF